MAQKKVVKSAIKKSSKKVSKKAPSLVKRKDTIPVVKKIAPKKSVSTPIISKKALVKRTRKATKLLLYSLVIFVVSFILYGVTSVSPLEEVFGFIVIFSGAIVLLGLLSEIIFFFLKRLGRK